MRGGVDRAQKRGSVPPGRETNLGDEPSRRKALRPWGLGKFVSAPPPTPPQIGRERMSVVNEPFAWQSLPPKWLRNEPFRTPVARPTIRDGQAVHRAGLSSVGGCGSCTSTVLDRQNFSGCLNE